MANIRLFRAGFGLTMINPPAPMLSIPGPRPAILVAASLRLHGTQTMNAAGLLVKCLENEEVDYIFGLPGEENIDVMDALLDSRIRFIVTRHEQGAAFMADVYGRLTGKAGVCLST